MEIYNKKRDLASFTGLNLKVFLTSVLRFSSQGLKTPSLRLTPHSQVAPTPLEVAEIQHQKYRVTIRATLIHP
jgi:hypothetical protein